MSQSAKPVKVLERRVYAIGERLFKAGDSAVTAYVVQSGLVELRSGEPPHETSLLKIGAHGIVGELALIGRNTRPNSAIALEATTCVLVHESEFRRRLEATDPFVRGVFRVLVDNLSRPWVLPGGTLKSG